MMRILFAFSVILVSVEASSSSNTDYKVTWPHLSFDPENFACSQYNDLCNVSLFTSSYLSRQSLSIYLKKNFLDEISCNSTQKIVKGCGSLTDPSVPDTLDYYSGTCKCLEPVYFDISGAKIGKQLFDNRVKPDVFWNMLPWQGPPFDVTQSYLAICNMAMERLDCPDGKATINPNGYSITNDAGVTILPYTCACGSYTVASSRVAESIVDKINESPLVDIPIFEDPINLSLELTIHCCSYDRWQIRINNCKLFLSTSHYRIHSIRHSDSRYRC
jgi:hypothetical protein